MRLERKMKGNDFIVLDKMKKQGQKQESDDPLDIHQERQNKSDHPPLDN